MKEIMRLSLPITLWLVGFSAVYALQGFSCSRHWPDHLAARPLLIASWISVVLIQVFSLAIILYVPSTSRFLQKTAVTIAVTAVVAALWTSMPVLTGMNCD